MHCCMYEIDRFVWISLVPIMPSTAFVVFDLLHQLHWRNGSFSLVTPHFRFCQLAFWLFRRVMLIGRGAEQSFPKSGMGCDYVPGRECGGYRGQWLWILPLCWCGAVDGAPRGSSSLDMMSVARVTCLTPVCFVAFWPTVVPWTCCCVHCQPPLIYVDPQTYSSVT